MVNIQDFKRIDLRVAEIQEAEDHPNADKLLVLKLDLGGGETRQTVAGIRKYYSPEEIVGKRVIYIANLEPVMVRGVKSEGMILAVQDSSGRLSLISPEREVEVGSRVL
jgi:methionyl-tRNA synthetase